MKRLIGAFSLLLFFSSLSLLPAISLSPEELERALQLIENSKTLLLDSTEATMVINAALLNIGDSTENLKLTSENYASTTDSLNLILTQSSENEGSLSENLNESKEITSDLQNTTENLKPSFWESRLGRGLLYTAGTSLGAAGGATAGAMIGDTPGSIAGAAAGAAIGAITVTIIETVITREKEEKESNPGGE